MAKQLTRFILVGGLNTLVTMGLFHVLLPFFGHLLAYSLVYAFGIVVAYFLNAFFVFEVSKGWKSATMYPLIYVMLYLYGLAMMILIVDYLELHEMLALVLVIVSSVPVSFFMSRWFFAYFSRRQP